MSSPDRNDEWQQLRDTYLSPSEERPSGPGRGVHHVALLCTDVERTIRFYQGVLGFPLTDLFENRDYEGSTHLFFDIGNGNSLAFFDFPGLDLGPYAEVLGGLHHLAISVPGDDWQRQRDALEEAGVTTMIIQSSMYFKDPDGARVELISDPLGEMYGSALGEVGRS